MTGAVRLAAVVDEPIDVDAVTALVDDRRAGAVVSFRGVVRDHDEGRAVAALEYTAHPSAGTVLAALAAGCAERVRALAVVHRLGALEIGDTALLVAVSAAHRREAIACAAELVDRIKEDLPVWKLQYFVDGSSEWSNCP